MSPFRGVKKLVVEALAQQERAEYQACEPPDPRVVTRDILNATADELEKQFSTQQSNRGVVHWLRSQAAAEESEK